ncbi:hypothetical protein SNE40_018291 [Patella caerulea]|uniref:Uncharacterized protein n=1 Tax=Patella caerulea TaxID=87958 RepID=A0AAN8P6X4_PATCE
MLMMKMYRTQGKWIYLFSYKSQEHGTGRLEYIQQLCFSYDVVLIQEHWFLAEEMSVFEQQINNVSCHGVSAMDSRHFISGRPFGGCAILWKSNLLCKVKPVISESKRICAVELSGSAIDILICSVYMPCDSTNPQEFDDTLNDFFFFKTIFIHRSWIGEQAKAYRPPLHKSTNINIY